MQSLAGALVRRGATVEIVGHGVPIAGEDSPWSTRPFGPPVTGELEDAAATVAGLRSESPQFVIVDHYGLGVVWEQAAAEHLPEATIVAVDDLAGSTHDVDVLVDPNLGPDGPVSIREQGTLLLHGPAYSPLGDEYRAAPPEPRPREDLPRVLVALGGGRSGFVEDLVAAFMDEPRLDDVRLDVVVPDDAERAAVDRLLNGRARSRTHGRVPTLRPLLERADLVVGAGGTSSWQRLRLGLPSVLVTLADNQVRTGRALEELGLARWVDRSEGPGAVIAAFAEALVDEGLRARARIQGPVVVDGLGAERIAFALIPPAGPPVLKPVDESDAAALLAMANDPVTRAGSRDAQAIGPDEHVGWLRRAVGRADGMFWIGEVDGLAVGQVRFTRLDSAWELHYGLDPIARRRGWSASLVRQGLQRLPQGPVFAVVGVENEPSRRTLATLGFRPTDPRDGAPSDLRIPEGFSAYLLDRTDRLG
jgi:UDP-2,4-diacetamido-2,4,6-trideoxy-beta-L-altropyranose hydrolase